MSTSTISRVFAKFGRVITSRVEAAVGFLAIAAACASAQPAFVSNDFDADGVADVIARQRAFDILHPVIGEIVLFSGATKTEIRRISSDRENDLFGYAVSAIGDIDGDNVDDIAVGAPLSALLYEWNGRVDVFSGVDGDLLLQIEGSPGSRFGRSVGPAGDMNGDGVPDFLVGAYIDDAVGRMCIVYAHSGVDGEILRTFGGEDLNDGFGAAVLGVGDWNADGFPEIAITAPALLNPQNKHGRLYIFNGTAVGTEPDYVAAQTAATQVDGDGAIKQIFGRNLIMGLDLDADGNRDLAVLSMIDWSGSGVVSAKAISRTGTVLSSVAAERKLAGDVDKSMDVVIADLLGVLNGYGLEPNTLDPFSADSDGDGIVDGQDINAVLSQFGITSSLKDVLLPGGATSTALAFPMRASDDCDLLLAGIGEDCCANCPLGSLFPCGSSSLDPLAPGDPIDDCDSGGGPRPPGGGPRPPRPGNPPPSGGCNGDDNNDGIPNNLQNDHDDDGIVDARDCDSDCFTGDMSDCVPEPIDGGGWSGWPSAPPAAWDPPPPPSENGQCVERVYLGSNQFEASSLDGWILDADYPLSFGHAQWGNYCSANIAWTASSGTLIEDPTYFNNRYVYLAGASIGPGSITGTCQCGDTLNFTLANIVLEVAAPEVATGDESRPIASYLFVNNDDDDFDGIPDMDDPDVDGEDDLYELRLGPAQGINPAQFNETKWRLLVSSGLRVWYRPSQGDIHADLVTPSSAPPFEERIINGEVYRSFPLGATIHGMPRLREYLLEAVAPSATTTSMGIYLGFGGSYQLQELDYDGNAVTAQGWIANTAQVVATDLSVHDYQDNFANYVEIGHWGADANNGGLDGFDVGGAVNNANDVFIDHDPDRFYVVVRDPSMNIDAEVAEQLNVSVGTRVQYMDQAGIDDDLTSIRLLETGPNTGVFRSESQLLVMPDSGFSLPDDDLSVWSTLFGFAIPDDSINDRTHRARVSGGLQVRREFGPNTPESQIIHRPIFVRDPDYRRIAHVRVRVYNEPFEDAGYTDSSGQFGGAGDGIFSFEDVNGNGTHEPLDPAGNVFERSERFIDVSNSSRDLGLGHAGASSDGRGPVFKMSLIEAEMARASAIWTAAGIDIQFEDILAIDAPMIPGTNATVIDDAGVFNATNGPAIGDELLAMQAIADATPSRVEVIYCGYLLSAAGYARIPANHGQSRPVPLGENTYLFISSDSSSLQSVIAHELGHAFTNGDDFPTQSYIIYPGGDGGIETASPASSRRRLQRTTEIHARQIRLEGNFNMPGNRILVAP